MWGWVMGVKNPRREVASSLRMQARILLLAKDARRG